MNEEIKDKLLKAMIEDDEEYFLENCIRFSEHINENIDVLFENSSMKIMEFMISCSIIDFVNINFLEKFNDKYHDVLMKIIREKNFLNFAKYFNEKELLFLLKLLGKDMLELDYSEFLTKILGKSKRECLKYVIKLGVDLNIVMEKGEKSIKVRSNLTSRHVFDDSNKHTIFTMALYNKDVDLIHFLMDEGCRLHSFDYRVLKDNDEICQIVSEMENFDDVMNIKDMGDD